MGVFNNANEQGVDPEITSGEPLGGKFNGRVSSPFIKQYFIDFSKRSDFCFNGKSKLFRLGNKGI